MLNQWIRAELEALKDAPRAIVCDPLQLTPAAGGVVHAFGAELGFVVVTAATNLAFRALYGQVCSESPGARVLLVDRTPLRRLQRRAFGAPPVFCPDFLAIVPDEARLTLRLRTMLAKQTGDALWPQEVDELPFCGLIQRHLDAVLQAHRNLRQTTTARFTDADLRTIVAFAALGVPHAAFTRLDNADYWRIGLLGHGALSELEELAPTVKHSVDQLLSKAPAPFCWFVDRDSEQVVRAFYLALVLSQHLEQWALVLPHIDPSLTGLTTTSTDVLRTTAPKLVALGADSVAADLRIAEESLEKEALQVLSEQLKLDSPDGWAAAIEREHYSSLLLSLCLLVAAADLASSTPNIAAHERVAKALQDVGRIVRQRQAQPVPALTETWELYRRVLDLKKVLDGACKQLSVTPTSKLSFGWFRGLWTDKGLGHIEHTMSRLERTVDINVLLPLPAESLPQLFAEAEQRLRVGVGRLGEEVNAGLAQVNRRFQELVAEQYPNWVERDQEPVLTAQLLRRVLKPNWDHATERAVLLVFDGMRLDIWEDLLKPLLLERCEVIHAYPGCALLPSETHVSRKAIAAGAFPAEFDARAGEDRLLASGLQRELGIVVEAVAVPPPGTGSAEVVRYRAGNLDVVLFELCDKELHKIKVRKVADGREVPGRPLAFVYDQLIRNLLEHEVMALVRDLPPGTKVVVVADHGFGRVGRDKLYFDDADLNEPRDCSYLNCLLRVPLEQTNLPQKVRQNIIAFTPEQLRLPTEETRTLKTGETHHKTFGAVAFPRVGYAFSRSGSPFDPDAYSHGGISLQELLVPMIVLRVKEQTAAELTLEQVEGPTEVMEGEAVEMTLRLRRIPRTRAAEDLRVEIQAVVNGAEQMVQTRQIVFLQQGVKAVRVAVTPNQGDATADELRLGALKRTVVTTVIWREGSRALRLTKSHGLRVQLNTERVIRRVPPSLGAIMGLAPKGSKE